MPFQSTSPLHFQCHTVGEWETVSFDWPGGGNREISQRSHLLKFVCETLHVDHFIPTATVNAQEFVGTRPGLLLCNGVQVSKACQSGGGGSTEEILEELKHKVWLLEYRLTENASQKWNELYTPTANPDKARRVTVEFAPEFSMNAFFGAIDFKQDKS